MYYKYIILNISISTDNSQSQFLSKLLEVVEQKCLNSQQSDLCIKSSIVIQAYQPLRTKLTDIDVCKHHYRLLEWVYVGLRLRHVLSTEH